MFSKVKEIIANSDRASAIDHVYDTLDELCLGGDFITADAILLEAVSLLYTMPASIIGSALMITKHWNHKLKNWSYLNVLFKEKHGWSL